MGRQLQRFVRDESGATAIEYALIATVLAGALLSIWPLFYDDYMKAMTDIGSVIAKAVP